MIAIYNADAYFHYGSSRLDALTDIVQLLRPRTVLLGSMAAAGHWGVRMPPQPGPTFYLVMEGSCWFAADGEAPVELGPGDFVLSARPQTDRSFSHPGVATAFSDAAFKASHSVDGELRLGDPDVPPTVRKLGGLILCDPANADLLVGLLPRFVYVRADDWGAGRLRTVIDLIREEAGGAAPGRESILARLIEVLLIGTLRQQPWTGQTGVLAALADPRLARALAAIHADVQRGWAVAELARVAGMSRSAFARRFTETVGAAPVEYLLGWRMAVAKDALRHGHGTLEEIAAMVGYQSASAFSTTFSRRVGCPPREFVQRIEHAVT